MTGTLATGHATAYESPELIALFQAYTAAPTSIGAALTRAVARAAAADPLIVATGSDIALYPGNGAPPQVEGFRISTRGFKELAAVSHLGPAVASLLLLGRRDPDAWSTGAQDLLAASRAARRGNDEALWRDRIAVRAFAGRETAIAAMVDYAGTITERYLERALADPTYPTPESLRRDLLEGPGPDLPVPLNRVMVATFFLTGLDIAHRLIAWFDRLALPWERAMVVVAGRQGRPTSGVTRETNSVAGVIQAASRGRLPRRRLLIAPHAPVFPPVTGPDLDHVAGLEDEYRRLWAGVLATADLGGLMFDGYPGYAPVASDGAVLDRGTPSVAEMPPVAPPYDWFALTTRLRVVLEDPRQLLSGAVTDVAAAQLVAHDNDPRAVAVPGLDGEPYPPLPIADDPGDRS